MSFLNSDGTPNYTPEEHNSTVASNRDTVKALFLLVKHQYQQGCAEIELPSAFNVKVALTAGVACETDALLSLFASSGDWHDGADFRGALGNFLGMQPNAAGQSPCVQLIDVVRQVMQNPDTMELMEASRSGPRAMLNLVGVASPNEL